MAMEELIALRLSEEELGVLDAIAEVQGDPSRSACIRSLIDQACVVLGLDRFEKVSVLDQVKDGE